MKMINMIVREKAPVRISFGSAGDTDFYINLIGKGVGVNATINLYSYCEIHPRNDDQIVLRSLETGHVLKYNSPNEIKFDSRELNLMKAVVKHFGNTGIEVITYTDAPLESGLGGSAAHCVAMIKAFNNFNGIDMNKEEIAKLAYHLERNVLGISGGYQDQWASSYGGINYLEFTKNGVKLQPIQLNEYDLQKLENNLLMVFIPRKVSGNDIHKGLKKDSEESLALLNMKIQNIKRIRECFEKKQFELLGKLLHLDWKIKKQMTKLISNEYIDEIYTTAVNAGADGGRLMGAGAGGCFIFHCGDKQKVLKALEPFGAKEIRFKFERINHTKKKLVIVSERKKKIENWLNESIYVKQGCKNLIDDIEKSAEIIIDAYKNGGKVLIFGNGGSAADSQHVAGELINKFRIERKPLAAIALTTDTSVLSSISNDFSFHDVFKKQIEALGSKNDVAIGISTSGNSKNVINGMIAAKQIGMKTIALTGKSGGKLKDIADICINVPSADTPRIQESHITILHIICDLIESELFKLSNQ